ncbi:MAG: DUF1800 domain-containing protein, partial [Rhodothermales bacterium]|nr:DUF1800 domain-containing protein [Rhodothermales bacterium]
AQEMADELVDEALAMPLPDPPDWANEAIPGRGASQEERAAYMDLNAEWQLEYRVDWLSRMRADGLRERLALTWHNHFVTGTTVYRYAVFSYRYVEMLRRYALGNLKAFVHAVGLDPAMLIYLNGIQNRAGAPNENYARELLELFTMGQAGPDGSANYTEDDIQEIARAMTGWQVSGSTLEAVFFQGRFDDGQKTIFGETAVFDYDGVIDLLFEKRGPQIAHFVCRHLYESLVYAEADEAFVADLAALLVSEDFELAPVIRALMASAHFHDPVAHGAQIKSPLEHAIGLTIETAVEPTEQTLAILYRTARANGQSLLDPPNVAGWPGHHDWINTTTLPYRWFVSDALLSGRGGTDIDLVPLAEMLHDTSDTEAAFRLPLKLVEHLIPAPADLLDIPEIADEFGGDLVNFPIPEWVNSAPPHVRNLAKMFLGGLPWYEWSPYVPGANERLTSFVRQLSQYPEHQLA